MPELAQTPTPIPDTKGQRSLFKDSAIDEMKQEVSVLAAVLKACHRLHPTRAIDVLQRALRRQTERGFVDPQIVKGGPDDGATRPAPF